MKLPGILLFAVHAAIGQTGSGGVAGEDVFFVINVVKASEEK